MQAIEKGHFAKEIVPVGDFATDEGPRPSTTMDKLAVLKTVFRKDGVVTAGSPSPLSDGAAALVLASEAAVEAHNVTPRARVIASVSAGVAPHVSPSTWSARSATGSPRRSCCGTRWSGANRAAGRGRAATPGTDRRRPPRTGNR